MATPVIPGDMLLPQPSILQKIVAHDDKAAQTIINRTKEIAAARRAAERAAFRRENTPLKILWRGMADAFKYGIAGRPPLRQEFDHASRINDIWASVGDDMRAAIQEYMTLHPQITAKLDLSVAEKDSLRPLRPAPAPRGMR